MYYTLKDHHEAVSKVNLRKYTACTTYDTASWEKSEYSTRLKIDCVRIISNSYCCSAIAIKYKGAGV